MAAIICTMVQICNKSASSVLGRCDCCLDDQAARFFKALCDPNRLAILARLAQCGRACTVGEIARCCPTDLSVVSRHLGILRDAGIVTATRKGRQVIYAVRFDVMISRLRQLADTVEACCPTETPDKAVCTPAARQRSPRSKSALGAGPPSPRSSHKSRHTYRARRPQ